MADIPRRYPDWGPLWRSLVTDPKHYRRLRTSWFLLLYLLASVNRATGKLQTTWAEIAEETGLSEAQLRSMGGHLRVAGYIGIYRTGLEQVLFVVHGWVPLTIRRVLKSEVRAIEARGEDVACPTRAQPTTPPLALEVADQLDAEDRIEEIVELVNAHPEKLIRSKLEVVLGVPNAKIRVSRFALFRYLLQNHEDES